MNEQLLFRVEIRPTLQKGYSIEVVAGTTNEAISEVKRILGISVLNSEDFRITTVNYINTPKSDG